MNKTAYNILEPEWPQSLQNDPGFKKTPSNTSIIKVKKNSKAISITDHGRL
jgi:hypothetical protein